MIANKVTNSSGSLFRPVEIMADLTDEFGSNNIVMGVVTVAVTVDGLNVGFANVMK
ncbi:hypothetical protein D9M69_657670 [compost metagenome]